MAVIDLTNQTFGRWTVLERDYETQKQKNSGKAFWKCQCQCGTIRSVIGADLRGNKSKSCGKCNRVPHNFEDLTGKTFNFLTVIERIENRYEKAYWKCRCVCGKEIEVSTSDLKQSHTISCGCKKKERIAELGRNSIKDLTGMQFGYLTVLSKTENRQGSNVKWLCRCVCGKEYEVAGGDLTKENGTRSCGCINMTKGEQIIDKILKELDIKYEREKKFENCCSPKTGYPLRYDFYLPDYNILIEYDGIQHFQEVEHFSQSLKDNQEIDKYKNNYAIEHNMHLIRIPYYEYSLITPNYISSKIKEVING